MERQKSQYRLDVQGLRGIAVLLVVLYHADLSFSGGFVGVDAFFVISGFVITSGVFVSLENERFSLRKFAARRVRRLLPMLSLVLSTCLLLNTLFAPLSSSTFSARTAIAAALWNANHYLIRNTSYFDPSAERNPFLHTWSLSVEEQFYVVFPPLLLLAWKLTRRSRRGVFGVVTALVITSFALGVVLPTFPLLGQLGPKLAFFSSVTRAWEFGIGALLAIALPHWGGKGRDLLVPLGITGAAALLMSSLIFTKHTIFPSFNALAPVLATASLIATGVNAPNGVTRALSCKPLVWVGDLSYGWYLWHWPLIVYASATFPHSRLSVIGACVVSLLLAVLSRKFVEDPIRFYPSRLPIAALALICIAAPILTSIITIQLTPRIEQAPNTGEFRAMTAAYSAIGCNYRYDSDFARCSWNAGAKSRLILIGDSNARMLIPAIREATRGKDVQVTIRTHSGCPLGEFIRVRANSSLSRCAEWTRSVAAWLGKEPPSTVLIVTADDLYIQDPEIEFDERVFGRVKTAEQKQRLLTTHLNEFVGRLAHHRVEVLPPISKFVTKTPTSYEYVAPDDCSLVALEFAFARCSPSTALRDEAYSKYLCGKSACRMYESGEWLYRDGGHLSVAGSKRLAPFISRFIER